MTIMAIETTCSHSMCKLHNLEEKGNSKNAFIGVKKMSLMSKYLAELLTYKEQWFCPPLIYGQYVQIET